MYNSVGSSKSTAKNTERNGREKMEEGISRIGERKRVGILDVVILTFSQKISELRTL